MKVTCEAKIKGQTQNWRAAVMAQPTKYEAPALGLLRKCLSHLVSQTEHKSGVNSTSSVCFTVVNLPEQKCSKISEPVVFTVLSVCALSEW